MQRARPRGQLGAWRVVGSHPGPSGSGLHATLFLQEDGLAECADVEEAVGQRSKRRLIHLEGDNAHVRAVAWMDGLVAGRTPLAPAVQHPQVKKLPRAKIKP